MGEAIKVAVIVRDRPEEALRVTAGLTLLDATLEVFVLDRKLDKAKPNIADLLGLIAELELKMYSNNPENGYTVVTLEEMAKKLLEYDLVVPY